MKTRIRSAFNQVTVQMRRKAIEAYCDRLQRCLAIEGGHTEVIYARKMLYCNALFYDVLDKYMFFVEICVRKKDTSRKFSFTNLNMNPLYSLIR